MVHPISRIARSLILMGAALFGGNAFASCPAGAPFLFCSITIGSETEIDLFKAEAGVPVDSNGIPTDRTNDTRSADGCIVFHEFVRLPRGPSAGVTAYGPQRLPYDPAETWDPVTNTYPWHRRMLEEDIPGFPGKTCDALLVSGHHDFSNGGSGGAPILPPSRPGGNPITTQYSPAGDCVKGYCVKRNQFVYSEEFYKYQTDLPTINTKSIELPNSASNAYPGPRLLLSQLVRTKEVCGDEFINDRVRTDDYPGVPGPNSGKALLSGLKAVFLFACNFASANDYAAEKGAFNFNTAVELPAKITAMKTLTSGPRPGSKVPYTIQDVPATKINRVSYTFKERTQLIFGKAADLFAFPAFAPGGNSVRAGVRDFLQNQIKPRFPTYGTNYLTGYLAYLSGLNTQSLSPTAFAQCMLNKFNPKCEMILTGATDQAYHPGNHVIQCSLDKLSLPDSRKQYCSALKTFQQLWANRSDLRDSLLNCQKEGAAIRTITPRTYSDYDMKWFF